MPGDTQPTRSLWQRWGWLVRWGGTALGIAYVARLVDLARVEDALSRVSLGAVAARRLRRGNRDDQRGSVPGGAGLASADQSKLRTASITRS